MPRRFTAKLFRTGGSQAIRLPKECQMPGDEVTVIREEGRLIVEPASRRGWHREFLETISTPLPEGVFPKREQGPSQARDFES